MKHSMMAMLVLVMGVGAGCAISNTASDLRGIKGLEGITSSVVRTQDPVRLVHPERRGLLASPGFEGTPMKGVYFFAGERRLGFDTYTTHPLDPRYEHWNSGGQSVRSWVMDQMVAAHVNTVVMSYWSDMPQWSPMDISTTQQRNVVCRKYPDNKYFIESNTTVPEVMDAAQGKPLIIMPAIEQGNDPDCPEIPHFEFNKEFPFLPFELPDNPGGRFAPGLVSRIGKLVAFFRGRMNQWAQMYDRDGLPRYAVNIISVGSDVIDQIPNDQRDDEQFAKGFDDVAAQVETLYHVRIGFTIDTTNVKTRRYSAFPGEAGPALERTAAVLAIQGYASEVFSGLIKNGLPDPCINLVSGRCLAYDNNRDNLERLADWKRDALADWVKTRVPVVLDVDNGYDGRIVFGGIRPDGIPERTGYWGDNQDYTEDRWRNWMSELKGSGPKGIVFDTWNGYTEGYAAVPSFEHGRTVYRWLTDMFEPPVADCSHMHYVNGAPTQWVYGAICVKWKALGADRAFGAPVSEELPSGPGRAQFFTDGKTIYWGTSGAFAVYGIIARTYREASGGTSCLGLPIADEEPVNGGRVSRFEHGTITWMLGASEGIITCR